MSQPRWLDVGTVGLYVDKNQLQILSDAMGLLRRNSYGGYIGYKQFANICDLEELIINKLKEKERSDELYGCRKQRSLLE